MRKATTPAINITHTSNMLLLTLYEPTIHTTVILGTISEVGIRITFIKKGIKANPAINAIIFPIYIDEIKPQTKSGLLLNNSGPGSRPHMIKPPNKIAVVAEPGIPNDNRGTNAPIDAALLPDSAAATPSNAPFPIAFLFFPILFSSTLYSSHLIVVHAPCM